MIFKIISNFLGVNFFLTHTILVPFCEALILITVSYDLRT